MSSILGNRSKLGQMLGKMFGGKRDLYKVFGYSETVSYARSYGKYNRQDIVGRVIDAPADALWTIPPTITTGDKVWDAAWEAATKTTGVWNAIGRADRLAGLGKYSILLFGFDDGLKIDQPVRGTAKSVTFTQPYSVDAAKVQSLVTDTLDPRYLKPYRYVINPAFDAAAPSISIPALNVDGTRVLHIVENPLTDEIYGNPRIERIFNLTDDLLKVVGGTAETFWLTGNKGMQIDIDKDMDLTADDEKALSDEIDEYQHQLRRVMRTRGVKINPLGSDVPDPKTAFEMLISLVSGATGIPKRILLGSEAGQLASEQDRNNWAERILERRKNFGEAQVLWPLIRLWTAAGVLPQIDLAKVVIEWPDAFTLSPLEAAQTAAQRARSAANMSKACNSYELFTEVEARQLLQLPDKMKGKMPKQIETQPSTGVGTGVPETNNGGVEPAGNDALQN